MGLEMKANTASAGRGRRAGPGAGLDRRPASWRLLAAVLLLAGGFQAAAQEPPSSDAAEPRFLIEAITVEDAKHISSEIIVAESLLAAGESYTEEELRQAVHRIVRLPFILDAEFSLRKGSERGRFELVVSVDETRRWFFGLDSNQTWRAEPISISGLTTTSDTSSGLALVGRRFSVGSHGVFFLALGGEEGTLTLGYQQFDLFGRSVSLDLSYSYSDCGDQQAEEDPDDLGDDGCRTELFDLGLDPTFSTWSQVGDGQRARIQLGVPLRGNRSVRFLGSYRDSEFGLRRQAYKPERRFFLFKDRRELELNVSWVFNSVDDPVVPTEGVLLEGGLDYHSLEAELTSFGILNRPPQILAPMDSAQLGALFTGARYWPVGERQTASVKIRAFLGRSDLENVPTEDVSLINDEANVWRSGLTLGHAMFLVRKHRYPKWRDLRWENELDLFSEGTSSSFGQDENPLSGFRLGTGLVFRNSWGVFRVQFNYLDAQ